MHATQAKLLNGDILRTYGTQEDPLFLYDEVIAKIPPIVHHSLYTNKVNFELLQNREVLLYPLDLCPISIRESHTDDFWRLSQFFTEIGLYRYMCRTE